MATLAEYDAWKSRKQQVGAGKANIVLSQPFYAEPDQFAADQNLATEASAVLGRPVPPSMMADPASKSVFDQIVAEKKRSTILTQSPRMAEWLRAPDNAAMGRDDLEGLSWWETFTSAAGNAIVQRGGLKLGQNYNQWMAEGAAQRAGDVGKSFGDVYGEERANVGPIGNVLDNAVGPITDVWNAGSRVLQAKLSEAFGGDQQQAAAYYQQQVGLIGDQIAKTPMSPGAEAIRTQIGGLKPTGDMGVDFTNFVNVVASDPAGFTSFLAETAAETAPTLAAAFGVGVVTRNPSAMAASMGVGSAVQERFSAPQSLMAERGIDISTPEGALAAISDPELMRDAAQRGEVRALIIGALDTISGGVAGETLSANPMLNMALQSVIQAAFGSGGEAGAQIASGQQLNISEVLIEGLAEFVTAPLEVGGMAASRVREQMEKSPAATATAETLTEMAANAANSPLRNRSPDTFRNYLQTVTAGTSAENLFVPADQFVQYFQGAGIDPFELADSLTGMSRADVQTAIDTGGSVKIPTATWAADMAGSEHDAFMISNSAFSPDASTAQEAAEFEMNKNDLMNEAWDEAEAIRKDAEQYRQVYEIEMEQLVGSLRAAGQATDVAKTNAIPVIEARRVAAEREGMTPEEFAALYPLIDVRGERPEGLDPKNVDALTRTLAEARARRSVGLDKAATPLLEFISERGGIVDPGGELKNLGASVIKRPGKKTLRVERSGVAAGMRDMLGGSQDRGLDTTARAAMESGFLGDDPDVLAWQEAERNGTAAPDLSAALLRAIEREVAGDTEAAVDDLGGVEEYLAGLGVGLDDSDADIRAAIEATRQYDKPVRVDNSGAMLTRAQQKAEERIAEINRLNPQLSTPITIEWVDGSSDPTKPNAEGSHGGFKITISRKATNPDAIVIHELRHVIDSLLGLATLTRTIDFMKGDAEFDALIAYLKSARDDGRIPDDAYWIAADSEVAAETAGSVIAAYFNDRAGLQAVAPDLVELLDGMDAGKYAAVVEPMPAAIEGDGEGRAYGQFAGIKAQGADMPMLTQAINMTADAENTPQDIFDATGYFRGPDGLWRFEISDADAILKPISDKFDGVWSKRGDGNAVTVGGVKLGAVLEHDKLFAAYPDLTGISVSLTINPKAVGGTGAYTAGMDHIEVRAPNMDELRSVLLHEIAHAIQNREGFALGGNSTMGEVYAGERVEEFKQAIEFHTRGWEKNAKKLETETDPEKRATLEARLAEYAEAIEATQGSMTRVARYEYYRRLAGEVEARNVQRRDELAREGDDLATDGPWWTADVPADQVIIVRSDDAGQGFKTATAGMETAPLGPVFVGQGLLFQPDMGFNGAGGGSRGSIQFPSAGISNGQTIISLAKTADLSTFLHETGHYLLALNRDLAARNPDGSAARDLEVLKSWWRDNAAAVAADAGNGVTADDVRNAIDNGTTGDAAKDRAVDTGMHEQFARGAEAYFLEGKAPSAALRPVFETFRAWLVSIYRNLKGLNVNVTDELRGVFDRMLATDAEIAAARQDIGADVNLTAADLGMTDEQFAGFVKLRDQAKADATAKLLADTMAPIARAREKWFKDERKKVHADVERNTNAQPVYRAMEWMGNRRWLGDDAPENMPDIRFSKSVLVDRYGEGVLSTLPRGKFTVYAVEGGIDPDDAAGWFGFQSGDAMVQAMERAPNRKEFIEAETDKVMRERHGDALRDGSVEQLAIDAVHTDSRGRELATELAALNEIAGTDRGLTAKEAKETARRTLSQMRTRDALASGRFLAAERKAGAEVAKLAATVTRDGMWMNAARRKVETQARAAVREGDAALTLTLPVEKANQNTERFNEDAARLVEAKRRQLLNHALYSEALAVADEVAKAERMTARLAKAVQRRRSQDGKQTISNESLDAIGELIERYDFRKLSATAEDRRGSLNKYLESMLAQGRENEISIPRKVLIDAAKVPYKTLSVADLRGVVDTLKNLESTGRRWQNLLIAKKQREMDDAVGSIVTALTENVGLDKGPTDEENLGTAAKAWTTQYLATFTTASTAIRKIDGRQDLGPVYELLKSDIDDAAYSEREMREAAAGKIEALYSVYSRDEQRRMAVRKQTAVGSYSKWNLISMALNMGNEGNMHRLTNKKARRSLTTQQVELVKGLLDKRDWDFVQSVWDYLDTYRPLIAERQKRVTGVEPEWVDATAVVTPVGTYRGGYYPIKYAAKHGGATTPSLNGDADIIKSMQVGSYAKAATKNGHLEARVANVQQSLLFDVGVIATHTNEVIHDLTFSEPIANSWRLLNDQRVSAAMLEAGMQEQHEALKLWLKDVAVGQVFASDVMSRMVRNLRSGFTVSRLAFNVGTALLQPTGLMQSAVVVGKRELANAIIQYSRNPKAMADEVIGRSRVMNERRTTFQKDLMDMVAETNISSPTGSRFKDVMNRYAVPASLAMMTYTQFYIVDVPTWAAAYEKGMRQFDGDQAKATEYADMTINRVQGGGLWSERSNIERGTWSSSTRQSALVTLFTTLGSYFFAKMNLLIERTDAVRAEPLTVGGAASYAFDIGLLLAGEAAVMMLAGAAKDGLFGGDDDDEDENPAMTLGVEAMKVFAAGLPGIRDGVSVMQGFSGGTYAGVLDLIVKPAKEIGQGEFDKGLVKSFVNLAGVAARLPAAQANRVIDAGWRDFDGEDVAPMEYLLGKPR